MQKSAFSATDCSVIIPTFGRHEVLIETLQSVFAQESLPGEVIVVDQNPSHPEKIHQQLTEWHAQGRIVWVRLPEPHITFARNLGAALANGEILVFIDDDVLLYEGFFQKHAAIYNDPSIVAANGQSIDQTSGVPFGFIPMGHKLDTGIGRLVGTGATCNLSVRRTVFLQQGGFDQSFAGQVNRSDADLALRWRAQGIIIEYSDGPTLTHRKFPSGGVRVYGRHDRPEWTRSVGDFHYALRHGTIWDVVKVFRPIGMRRENVMQFWRLPWAMLSCLYGFIVAWQRNRQGFRTSLTPEGVTRLRSSYLAGRDLLEVS